MYHFLIHPVLLNTKGNRKGRILPDLPYMGMKPRFRPPLSQDFYSITEYTGVAAKGSVFISPV